MKERGHLQNQGLDGKIILKCILRKWGRGTRTGLIWFRIGRDGRQF